MDRVYCRVCAQEVDGVSIGWMLDYLDAALAGHAYPPNTNIYGTPWKVPARSERHPLEGPGPQRAAWPLKPRSKMRPRA